MHISLDELCQIFHPTSRDTLAKYVDGLNAMFDKFNINTAIRIRAFLCQVGVECQGFTRMVENLNYSSKGLRGTFPTHFNQAQAVAYARQPERIANRAYANRLGNRDEASGDGWKYRGRGAIQVTGHDNYKAFADYMKMSIEQVIPYLQTPEGAIAAAGWYWTINNLNRLADAQDIKGLTRKINGGLNGLADRMAIWTRSAIIK